ncbi:hypothetical protein F5884DRAFT_811932 [Xylogone sp. PMI_703]|nr:hypothetical protein F5884DRAFT_811932 [Xylogone sp. PMI_703]
MASSPSVMAGLVCLCLEAAPGYISLAVSAHPRPAVTIASPLHALFHTVPSSPSLELSTSPVALAAIPSFTKTFQVYFLLAALYVCTTTLQLGSLFIPPSPTHLHSLSFFRRFRTLNSRQFPCLLPALDIDYDLLLCEAPSRLILSSPPSTFPPPPLQLDSSHDRRLMNSIDHYIVRLRPYVLDRPRIPLRNLLPPLCLTLGGGYPRCY